MQTALQDMLRKLVYLSCQFRKNSDKRQNVVCFLYRSIFLDILRTQPNIYGETFSKSRKKFYLFKMFDWVLSMPLII